MARRLGEVRPDATVTVLEKEDGLALHQTGRNSGVVHAGLYYPPGSLKATAVPARRRAAHELLRGARRSSYEICGKLVVALDDDELPGCASSTTRGRRTACPASAAGRDELRELEPHAAGVAALHSPSTAIADYRRGRPARSPRRASARRLGALGARVTGIAAATARASCSRGRRRRSRPAGDLRRPAVRPRRAAGRRRPPSRAIVPFRGEYYRLRPERRDLVRGLIYPVPDPRFPFLGVHLTRAGATAPSTSARTPCSRSPGRATAGATSGRRRCRSLGRRVPARSPAGTGGRASTSCAAR